MKKRGVTTILISLVLLTAAAVGLACQASLAIWENSNDATLDVIPDEIPNPSDDFLVYAAVGASGNLLTSAEFGTAEIAGAAVVGYGGSLAAEVRFPSEYTFIDGESSYPVIRIASFAVGIYAEHMGEVYTGDKEYNFSLNGIVTTLIIPSSVTSVAAGVFMNMSYLKAVIFESASVPVTVENKAFMGCRKLSVLQHGRRLIGESGGALSPSSDAFLFTALTAFEEIE